MRKLLFILTCFLFFDSCTQKSRPQQQAQLSEGRRLEILFLGHDSRHHDSEKFFPMLSLPLFQKGINLTYISDPDALYAEIWHATTASSFMQTTIRSPTRRKLP